MNRLTNEESIILKNLPKQFEYIARHNNLKGDLYIFTTKPYMREDFFRSNGHQMPFNQFRHIFKGIKKGDYLDIGEAENE